MVGSDKLDKDISLFNLVQKLGCTGYSQLLQPWKQMETVPAKRSELRSGYQLSSVGKIGPTLPSFRDCAKNVSTSKLRLFLKGRNKAAVSESRPRGNADRLGRGGGLTFAQNAHFYVFIRICYVVEICRKLGWFLQNRLSVF